jgi:glycosyltransferase involved in cell wall biosynthesis
MPLPARQEDLLLSVVIPVYNERFLVRELLRRVRAVRIPQLRGLEILVVDDGSSDGTREILAEIDGETPEMRLILHDRNRGKGAAVRTGISAATGDLIVIQDADLEYDPRDFTRLVTPFLEDGADVVYGSRFLTSERRRVLYFRHALGNRLITLLSNWATDLNLTDVETCYKMFRAPLLKSLPIRSNDFAMEPELTAKIAKRNCRVFEVPISYVGRTYREGKKIGWRDGFKALYTILKFKLIDDLYKEDEYGSHILHDLEHARRFNRWMAEAIRPWVGGNVLEIGAGIGNITAQLLPRDRYLASDINLTTWITSGAPRPASRTSRWSASISRRAGTSRP